jgi:hypothetical protein
LNDDLDFAVRKYADWFDSKEELLVTAAAFAIQNIAEFPPPNRKPKRLAQEPMTQSAKRRRIRLQPD